MNRMTVKQYLGWLWRLSAGVRGPIAVRIAVGLLRVGLMLAFVVVCKRLVDMAVGGAGVGDMGRWLVAMVGCMVCQLAVGAVNSRLLLTSSVRNANGLRSRMFDRAMNAAYGGGLQSADVIERMKKDADTVSDLVCSSMPTVVVTAVQLVAAFLFLSSLDWRLGLVMVVIMPVALVAGKLFVGRMRRLSRHVRQTDSAVHAHVQEHLRHRSVDLAFESTGRAVSRLDRLQLRLYRLMRRRNNYSVYSRLMIQAGFAAGYATAFIWGVCGLSAGAVTFGMMTAFLQLVGQVQRPAVELAQQLPGFIYGMASAERIREVIDAQTDGDCGGHGACGGHGRPSSVQYDGGSDSGADGGVGLRFDDVSFAYPDGDAPVLSHFSALFEAGRVSVVRGVTGAGKTTMLRLILGFLKPDEGSVSLFDGSGRSASASAATRRMIAYVPQGNTLMSGTIRENLRLGAPDASAEEMRKALALACAEFVEDLPMGLETRIGEGGAHLSEGQAQRIAIARALLRCEARLMLLDEPSSALDAATERRLMENLGSLTPERTIIIITHRDSPAGAWAVEID